MPYPSGGRTIMEDMMADRIYSEKSTNTESALISSEPGILGGILIALDGTNAQTITIYDGVDSTGSKLTPTLVFPTSATIRMASVALDAQYADGLYVAVSGSGSVEYTVYFKSR